MNRKRISVIVSVPLAALLGAVGCGEKAQSAASKAPAPPPVAAAQPASTFSGGAGKVLETMNTAGYTYVKADVGGKEVWAAGPETSVKVGDTVEIPEGMPMPNYHSDTLNRTFDLVYFVPAISAPGAAKPGPQQMAQTHGGSQAPKPAAVDVSGVKKAKGGQTVGEVYQEKAALSGKDITVRGKVVKVSSGIMGKNWVHIQDGTGGAGANDLTATTNGVVNVGDTVLVKGKLTTNKDFGSGYKYDVIVEDASVTKE